MQHAATDSVPTSPVLTSDVPHPSSSSSSSPFDQYKVICRNGSVPMRRQPHRGTMHIKDIHDRVESGLMRSGEHDVACTYVLYRKERARSRARAVTRPPLPADRCGCAISTGNQSVPVDGGNDRLQEEKNFFETRVTEYQTGGVLSWDLRDLGDWLWLPLETKRGLGVQ